MWGVSHGVYGLFPAIVWALCCAVARPAWRVVVSDQHLEATRYGGMRVRLTWDGVGKVRAVRLVSLDRQREVIFSDWVPRFEELMGLVETATPHSHWRADRLESAPMAIAPMGPVRFLFGALGVARVRPAGNSIAKGGSTMAKFIQICASQNDVFALDEEGDIYQYHFNLKTWVKLRATRELEDGRGVAKVSVFTSAQGSGSGTNGGREQWNRISRS